MRARLLASALTSAFLASTIASLNTGCAEDDDDRFEALTCEYLSDPGNCWAEAAVELASCVPGPEEEYGIIAADRASCEFSDGSRVVFDEALPEDIFDLERLAMTFERDGSECGRFVDTFANRMELEAGSLGAVSQLRAGGRFELLCDAGPSYFSEFDLLFECPGGTAPTDGFDVAPNLVTLTIVSIETPTPIFTCTGDGAAP
jgi:hypothetical protein